MSMTDVDVPMFGDDVAPPLDPIEHPAPAEKRKGGRPLGSRTDPAKKAAAAQAKKDRDKARYERNKASRESVPPLGRIIDPTAGQPGRPTKLAAQSAVLTQRLAAAYELAGTMLIGGGALLGLGARFVRVGEALQVNAEACAASIVKYSETNDRVRQLLENAGTGLGFLAIGMAHAPILMAAVGRTPDAPAAGPAAPGMAGMMAEAMAMAADPTSPISAMMNEMFGGNGEA